jgi:hypothetical protein
MRTKKGWIRIFEATVAILLVSSVLVVVYTRQPDRSLDASEYVYTLQKEILDELSLNETLRSAILSSDEDTVSAVVTLFVASKIPSTFDGRIRICPLSSPPSPCKLNETDFLASKDSDVFVTDTVIASNLTTYSPKKVRLFVWERV